MYPPLRLLSVNHVILAVSLSGVHGSGVHGYGDYGQVTQCLGVDMKQPLILMVLLAVMFLVGVDAPAADR